MATSDAWWAIGANVQPIAGVGTSYSYFYGTKAAAQAKAALVVDGTVTGPFTTEATAQAAVKAGKTSASPQAAETPSEIGSQVSSGVLDGIPASVGSFFSALGNTNTWIRVAKVVVGGLLLVIGLVHITGADNALASAARKVPLPV